MEGACRLAEAAPSSEGRGGALQGHPPCPTHLQPPAGQATPSITDEVSFVMAGLQTGDLGLLSSLVLALSGLSGVIGLVTPGEMGQRLCKT